MYACVYVYLYIYVIYKHILNWRLKNNCLITWRIKQHSHAYTLDFRLTVAGFMLKQHIHIYIYTTYTTYLHTGIPTYNTNIMHLDICK